MDEAASVKYKSIQDVIELCLDKDLTWGVCCNIKHMFRNLPVAEKDLPFLAFSWEGKVYLNSSIPFGARSSCKIFNDVADLLEWIVVNESGKTYISHFLDDFPMFEKSEEHLKQINAHIPRNYPKDRHAHFS